MNKINYDKHDWIDGEPITETLFNNIESGVGRTTSSTNLLVDRTNQEEEDLSTTEGKIEHQDMEFDIAIGEHDTLDERLKADVSRFVEVWSGGNYMPFEGKNIRIDNSKVGWIRDFKMSGETYQDPNNLSDIQSAGDLVDGRYKIEILSQNKNLFNIEDRYYYQLSGNNTLLETANEIIMNTTDTTHHSILNYYTFLKEGKQYRISMNIKQGAFQLFKGKVIGWSEGNLITDYYQHSNTLYKCIREFTAPSTGVYTLELINQKLVGENKFTDIIIQEVSSDLNYVEPKQNKTQILLDEPLMKLPNGTCDTIEQRDDGVYLVQRVEKVAYTTGDENLENCITDKTVSYKAKATPIETKLDINMSKWLTYQGVTYFTTTCNVQPTLSLKAPVDTQAIVSNLQATNLSLRRNNQQLEQENQQAEKELNTLQEQHDQQTADLLDMDMRVLILEE